MSEYIVQFISSHEFKVHKFISDEIRPDISYSVTINKNNRMSCSCPSGTYRKYCKHTEMVSKFKKSDKEIFVLEIE